MSISINNSFQRRFDIPEQNPVNQVDVPQSIENQDVPGRQVNPNDNGQGAIARQEQPQPASWLTQLNAIMKTATENTKGIFDREALASKFKQNTFPKELDTQYTEAEQALSDLNAMKGSDLAKAFTAEGKGAYKKAETAIAKLMDLARGIKNQMQKNGLQGDLQDMATRCELRAVEISRLMGELADLRQKQGDNAAELKRTVAELLPAEQLKDNYTDDILKKFQDKTRPLLERLDQLEKKNTENASDFLTLQSFIQEVKTMKNALLDARTNGVDMHGDGQHGRLMPNPVLFKAMEEILQKAEDRLAAFRDAFGANSIKQHLQLAFPDTLNCKFVQENETHLTNLCPVTMEMIKACDQLHKDLEETIGTQKINSEEVQKKIDTFKENYSQNYDKMGKELSLLYAIRNSFPSSKSDNTFFKFEELLEKKLRENKCQLKPDEKALESLLKNFQTGQPNIQREGTTLKDMPLDSEKSQKWATELKNFIANDLTDFAHRMSPKSLHMEYSIGRIPAILQKQEELQEQKEGYFTNDNLLAVYQGKISFCTVLEATVNNADPEMIDKNLDEHNLVGQPQVLGSGSANMVYSCKFNIYNEIDKTNETKEYVFKPEYQSKYGNQRLHHSKYGGHDSQQTIANLNHASYKCAKLLGLDNLITKSNVGTLKGKYGIFMEKAKGKSPVDIEKTMKKNDDECLSKNDILRLKKNTETKPTFRKIKGNLMRQSNQLQWLDLMTGQADRHGGNYKLEISKPKNGNDYNVVVKGIDNDQAFHTWRTGLTKVQLTQSYINHQNWDDLRQHLSTQNKYVTLKDGVYTIDFEKMPLNDMKYFLHTLCIPSLKVPDYIDEELKNKFLELGENPEKLSSLEKNLSPKAVELMKDRLKEICNKLKGDQIKVIKKEDWMKEETQKSMDKEYFAELDKQKTKHTYSCIDSKGRHFKMDLFYRDLAFLAEEDAK